MKKWLYLGIFFSLLGFGIWKFWCLGSIELPKKQEFTINIVHPGVEIRRKDQDVWQVAKSGDQLFAGDQIHTDGEGNAIIDVYGHGEARLGNKTEITVIDASREQKVMIRLQLGFGKLWTKLKRFNNLADQYQVERNGINSSVHGTAFDMQGFATSTQIQVSDSAVSIESKNTRHVLFEGYSIQVKSDGTFGKDEISTDEVRQTEWFQKNLTSDKEFDKQYVQMLIEQYEKRHGADPQSINDAFMRLSEKTHGLLQPSQKQTMYPFYAGRRLYKISELAKRGNEGMALQEYGMLEEEILKNVHEYPNSTASFQQEIGQVLDILADSMPSSSAYRLKQKIEDTLLRLAEGDPFAEAYVRLGAVQSRLFEASDLITTSSLDDAGTALDAAHQGIENISRDMEQVKQTEEAVNHVRDKLQVLRMREGTLRIRLATAIAPPVSEISTTSMIQTTSTTMTAPTTTLPEKVLPTEIPIPLIHSLQINPGNSILKGNKAITFHVVATYADGTKKDVTDASLLSASNLRLGYFLRNTFTANPNVDGQVDIVAFYTESNKTIRAQTSIMIQP
ncbi:hypothetical protein IT408_00495 [Candidatus Uhrbacteria bacterium]|nr:hypothetical protein [Candidatus Uhrbacteria bacterium]